MASPFSRAVNLTLFLTQPTKPGIFERDEFNNLVPACGSKSFPLAAYALRDGTSPDFLQERGRDETLMFFSCRSVRPLFVPGWVQSGNEIEAHYKEPASGIQQEGVFVITDLSNSPWGAVQRALGTAFKGYFKPGMRGNGQTDLEPASTFKEIV